MRVPITKYDVVLEILLLFWLSLVGLVCTFLNISVVCFLYTLTGIEVLQFNAGSERQNGEVFLSRDSTHWSAIACETRVTA